MYVNLKQAERHLCDNAKILLRKVNVRTGSEGYSPSYSFVIPINMQKALDIARSWFNLYFDNGQDIEIWISNQEDLKRGLLRKGYKTTRSDSMPSYYNISKNLELFFSECGVDDIEEFISLYNFRKLTVSKMAHVDTFTGETHYVLGTLRIKEGFRRSFGYSKSPLLVEYVKHMKGHRNSKGEEAPWVIVSHETGKVLSSHKTKKEAEKHLQHMHIFAK